MPLWRVRVMPDPFISLRERLLRAGVRPKTVRRYVAELREHLDDLTTEMTANGVPEPEAREQALIRLGSIDALAHPMEMDDRFRSWVSKAPWAAFLLAPLVTYAVAAFVTVQTLIFAATLETIPHWFGSATVAAQYLNGGALPIVVAWLLTIIALRQRSRPFWPLLGIGVAIFVGAAIQLSVLLPAPEQPGEIAIGVSLPSPIQVAVLIGTAAVPALLLPDPFRERLSLTKIDS